LAACLADLPVAVISPLLIDFHEFDGYVGMITFRTPGGLDMKARQVIFWFLLMLIISGCGGMPTTQGAGEKSLQPATWPST
jgi:hypothetical protein